MFYSLLKYTEYTITVVCFTSQGDGPEATPVDVRTQEDGNVPYCLLIFTVPNNERQYYRYGH